MNINISIDVGSVLFLNEQLIIKMSILYYKLVIYSISLLFINI